MKSLLFFVIPFALLNSQVAAAGRKTPKRHPLLPPITKPTEPATPGKIFSSEIGGKDLRFLADAVELGLSQVFLASLATSGAQSDRVKALANVLSQTQKEENIKISRLAQLKGINVADRDAAARDGLVRKFSKVSPDQFDSTWIGEIVALNEKAVANFADAAEFEDPDIKTFAQKALPLAKEKLSLVSGGGGPKLPKFRTEMSQPQPR